MNKKYVYLFSEGNQNMRELLGGKGANLAEMILMGMPVPQGFTVSTEACNQYYENGNQISDEVTGQIYDNLKKLEELTGKKFGDSNNPLLLSVRSGARVSMPGMMDTILNLGINDSSAEGLAKITGNPRFAYDSYRRFIQMFSDVVKGIPKSEFEHIIDEVKKNKGIKHDIDLNIEDLKILTDKFKDVYIKHTGHEFPSNPNQQLIESVQAVFRSWNNPRANAYRKMNNIPYSWGTAVNVQIMVFGNSGNQSCTGVAFSRNPATGENKLFGEYLINAQGEDVVAGVRTPYPIDDLKNSMPKIYEEFVKKAKLLEQHYKDMQDMEFTVENSKLYMLQTRNGKRTASAALKIAVDMVDEGKILKQEAVMRVNPNQLDSLLHPQFESLEKLSPIGRGLAASPGAACGQIVFNADDAKKMHEKGKKVILVRLETSPEDIEGMAVSEGILTVRGGMTSHAAVVARGMGTCCVSGCSEIIINEKEKFFIIEDKKFKEGDYISLDGSSGTVYGQKIQTSPAKITGDFKTFMEWTNSIRRLKTYANADTPDDVIKSISLGAEGIGLCRTEHMFFSEKRIEAIREMIVAKTSENRKKALNKLLPYQQRDFEKMYEALKGMPVTIRLLDPPLHEFLPSKAQDISELARQINISEDELNRIISELHEFNPMMGHRGCRLAVSYPEIAQMQTKAIIRAAIEVSKRHSEYAPSPEIMIPLTGDSKELKFVKNIIKTEADNIISNSPIKISYKIGSMIEIPRAALTADKIAEESEFFSFGTNDLTQMTFGFSRDDASKFLGYYYDNKIYEFDPFKHLDLQGVGQLIKTACKLGKNIRPDIKLGVCGEHGGDPHSIDFFNLIGLDYVSCSPLRVPTAKLAAAQAVIKQNT